MRARARVSCGVFGRKPIVGQLKEDSVGICVARIAQYTRNRNK